MLGSFDSPDDGFEEIVDHSDKAGGMNDEAGFKIFLVSPVYDLVEAPEPGERRLVRGIKTMMEVDKTVVNIHILVQGQHQVPEHQTRYITSSTYLDGN